MPWQKHALTEILTMQNGKYVRRVQGLVCARQQGKTELAKIRIIAGIYLFNEKDVILLSVNRKLSLITWRQIDYLIQNTPRLKALWAKSYTTNGAERIVFKNGAQISVVAATPNGSRGMTADLVFIDETRAIDQGTWDAAVYTTNARPLAQVLTVSNAGDKSSTVLNNLRDRAIANVSPTLGWLEWSAHPSREIMDKRGWVESNPALGWTMDEATMQHNAVTNDPLAFRVEVLCQFLDNLASPFEVGSWDKCADESIVVEPGGLTFFAFDKSYTHKYAVLVAGQKLDELRVKVKVLQVWSTTTPLDDRQLASDINAHIQRYRPRVVMYDKWVSENVASYLKSSGSPLMDVSGKTQNEASNRLAQLMSHGQVIHANEQVLNEAIAACATKHTEYGWKIVRRKSAGEICAAISVAMVAWYASRPQAVASIIVN
jgi:phage terminase large subunit-like protein